MLKLYHGRTSVCSVKARLAFAEKGVDFDSQLMTLQGDQYDPAYMKLNPNAVVPTLVHDDKVMAMTVVLPPGGVGGIFDRARRRTIAHLVFSGTVTRFPDIRWIFSHSGGTLPFLTGRFIRLANERKPADLPNGPLPEFRKFHYEIAQGNTPGQLAALLKLVPLSQVMFGTDFPFRPGAEAVEGLANYGFSAADLVAIESDNAKKLLPPLKT